MNLDDEPSLIDASRRGDPEAFASLVHRHQRMIHAMTFRLSGSEADAADLAQETFVQAWLKLASFRGEAKFSSWLGRIAINASLTWKSRLHREARAREEWSDEAALTSHPGNNDTRTRLVQEALLKLSAKQRAALVLTVYEGMNHAEAAAILNCSETTVSWRVFAARTKLKRWLRDLAPGKGGADE